MKGIRLFQRFVITLLIGVNAFVFMSMRDVNIGDNLIYTAGLVLSSVAIISLISFLRRIRKKKTNPEAQ